MRNCFKQAAKVFYWEHYSVVELRVDGFSEQSLHHRSSRLKPRLWGKRKWGRFFSEWLRALRYPLLLISSGKVNVTFAFDCDCDCGCG